MPINLNRAIREYAGLDEGWNSVKVVSKRTFRFNTGTEGVEYEVVREDGVSGKVSFPLTDKSFWKLGLFAKAAGVSEHTMDAFELGDVIGKKVDVLMQPGKNGYTEAKAFAPFGTGGTETITAPPAAPGPQAAQAPEPDDDGIEF